VLAEAAPRAATHEPQGMLDERGDNDEAHAAMTTRCTRRRRRRRGARDDSNEAHRVVTMRCTATTTLLRPSLGYQRRSP
jgi:hypothetical protein